MSSALPEEDLRRRYLDWCSSQVARRFLELSHDEVWLRSQRAGCEASDGPTGYLDLVRRTTLLLAREMDLPAFEAWKEAYLRDPAAFQKDMLGG